MKNYLITLSDSSKSQKKKAQLESLSDSTSKNNPKKHDYILIIGGDGTFLKTLYKLNKFNNARVIPINGGTIGFYSYFNTKNLNSSLKNITNEEKYNKPIVIN